MTDEEILTYVRVEDCPYQKRGRQGVSYKCTIKFTPAGGLRGCTSPIRYNNDSVRCKEFFDAAEQLLPKIKEEFEQRQAEAEAQRKQQEEAERKRQAKEAERKRQEEEFKRRHPAAYAIKDLYKEIAQLHEEIARLHKGINDFRSNVNLVKGSIEYEGKHIQKTLYCIYCALSGGKKIDEIEIPTEDKGDDK